MSGDRTEAECVVLRAPSIWSLIHASAAVFRVTETDILSARLDGRAVRARHAAMYLARELTGRSYQSIGLHFGKRDHSSVMNGVARISDLIARDTGLAEQVAAIRQAVAE